MRARGFTLIEAVISIVIVGIVFAIGSIVLNRGIAEYFAHKDFARADGQARLALERLARELRGMQSSTTLTTTPPTQIGFVTAAGTSVVYSQSGSLLLRNGAQLADDLVPGTLAFSYLDRNAAPTTTPSGVRSITVQFREQRGASSNLYRATVTARNLS